MHYDPEMHPSVLNMKFPLRHTFKNTITLDSGSGYNPDLVGSSNYKRHGVVIKPVFSEDDLQYRKAYAERIRDSLSTLDGADLDINQDDLAKIEGHISVFEGAK